MCKEKPNRPQAPPASPGVTRTSSEAQKSPHSQQEGEVEADTVQKATQPWEVLMFTDYLHHGFTADTLQTRRLV